MCGFSTTTLANDVRTAQDLLTKLNYKPGPVDGSFGRKTKRALENFYANQNQTFDGELSDNEIKDLEEVISNKQIKRQVNHKKILFNISFSLNVSSKPPGVLSKYDTEQLWTAYQTADECFKHPDYGKGKGYRLKLQKEAAFLKTVWRNPFYPDSPKSGSASVGAVPPNPLTVVILDESYGERNSQVENTAKWFRSASNALRQGASENTKNLIRRTLTNWAQAGALAHGINVSWGSKPVDWQVMTLISALVTTAAAMAPDFSPEDRALIGPWLNGLIKKVSASHWKDRQDNKAYMTAYITIVWAFMVSDDKAAQNSVDVIKLAIHDMRPDGSFPIDSQRSGMGLKYSTDSLGYLVMIAALVQVNTGQDLFSYDANGRSLHDAVNFIVKAIKNPSEINKIYAITCPEGGDRWGSITKPSLSFINAASFLVVYATLNSKSPNTRFIKIKYGNGISVPSEVFVTAPAMLVGALSE